MDTTFFNIVNFFTTLQNSQIEPIIHSWGVLSYINGFAACVTDNLLPTLSILSLKKTVIDAVVFTLKFITLIALLVFIRGGIPRYRYDFLTKIG